MTSTQPAEITKDSNSDGESAIAKSPLTVLDKLDKLSLNGRLAEMRKQQKEARFIAGRLALAGQITIFYAGPNKGKTLITLRLISEAISSKSANLKYYYINLDDNFDGLISKTELGNRYGFKVIGPDVFKKPNENFSELVDKLIEEKVADCAVFVLDTIKKFVDVMDKKASSQFMTTCRKLISAGGSIIALAHVNKNINGDESIPAGTSDTLDDCDCAYVLEEISEEKSTIGRTRTVEFRQKKSRGPNVDNAVYKYLISESSDYESLFSSVTLVDGNAADLERTKKAIVSEKQENSALITEIEKLLSSGKPVRQSDIVSSIMKSKVASRRDTLYCLKRWSCPTENGGIWEQQKGDRNMNLYQLRT